MDAEQAKHLFFYSTSSTGFKARYLLSQEEYPYGQNLNLSTHLLRFPSFNMSSSPVLL
jgi:hypothetical protein